jgi:hypothetical protein
MIGRMASVYSLDEDHHNHRYFHHHVNSIHEHPNSVEIRGSNINKIHGINPATAVLQRQDHFTSQIFAPLVTMQSRR